MSKFLSTTMRLDNFPLEFHKLQANNEPGVGPPMSTTRQAASLARI